MKHIDWSKLPQTTPAECIERYGNAAHAMQSGVAMKMHYGTDHEPKHLRVGVNSSMVDASALAELLIQKGVISDHEYLYAIMAGMEREVEMYEQELSEKHGTRITLV